jgi:hypothetical protein
MRRLLATGETKLIGKTVEITGLHKEGREFPVELSLAEWKTKDGSFFTAIIRDITERKRVEAERENLVHQLQEAMTRVKTLSGLLPICASCKKIRDDHGTWNVLEGYIQERSGAEFTHGLCPECAQDLYPHHYPGDPEGGSE